MEERYISLRFVSAAQLDAIVDLWDDKLDFQHSRRALLDPKNPLYPFISNNGSPLPVRSILACVRKHYKAFAIIEDPYLDLEFWDSHTGYYGTCFSKYPRECNRIHFFSGDEARADALINGLYNGENESLIASLDMEYLGYSVFRPIPSFVIGRTAIKFNSSHFEAMPSAVRLLQLPAEKHGIPYLKAAQDCKVTILNAKLEVRAPEFIQQDPHLGHCGTASLWVSTHISSAKFGTSNFRFPTITRHAVGKPAPSHHTGLLYNPLDPSTGLSFDEIKNALSATGSGYQEVGRGEGEAEDAALMRVGNFIYSYVESGLPVLLFLQSMKGEGHVVAVIGHGLPKTGANFQLLPLSTATNKETWTRHFTVSGGVNLYYVHDDCYGPYNRVVLVPPQTHTIQKDVLAKVKQFLYKKRHLDDNDLKAGIRVELGRKQETHLLAKAIVPTHFRIRNNAWNSLTLAVDLFEDTFRPFISGETGYLWRSYLTTGSEFKASLADRRYTKKMMGFYANIHMPKYIWVHELTECIVSEVNTCFTSEGTRFIDGEFIYDATSPSYDVKLISRRLYGSLWDNTDNYRIDETEPYERCDCFS